MKSKHIQLGLLGLLLLSLLTVFVGRQELLDWFKLRNYHAPLPVQLLVQQDQMTAFATHLFYLNHPVISASNEFSSHCPTGGEKTVVLGCYIGNDNGIYVYDVTDGRLDGVEQVTAAHEMLHAAYRRLPNNERKQLDGLLLDFYTNHLTDQRIKDTIDAYRQTEPKDVVNEMHSIFGTEVNNLPAPLESYYAKYFKNRSFVTVYTAKYQSEFTGRQTQIARYDVQLKELKDQITADQTSLDSQRNQLQVQETRMNSERAAGQTEAYNSDVGSYNQRVNSYNGLLSSTKNLINQYNAIVNARNAIALEEQQLTKELSSTSVSK